MKALSIKEPWATLILRGEKTIETRVWKTDYRGKLLLCACKNPKSDISGYAFAWADLIDCRPMTTDDDEAACCEIYDGAYSWVLKNVHAIDKFPVKGMLKLFEVRYP
jgi:hypothetical protein